MESSTALSSNNNNGNSGINNSSSRDSVLSPSAAAPSASPSALVEDDAAISVAAGLAKEAALLFQSGKFVECISVLNQLLQKKEGDPKILHNIAIAENFQNGCTDPKKLLEVLNHVKKRNEELARASEDQTESGSNPGSKISAGSKGSASQFSATSCLPIYIDEFDTSVTMFNIAVIWFHLHEYARSFSILDSLYQKIEPIDEGTALRICLLLLDVGLLSNQASRSADVITYVEKVFCMNSFSSQVDNGGSTQHPPTMVPKSASTPSNAIIPDASIPDTTAHTNALESSLSRTFSEEGLEDESLQLLSSLDISRENLPRPSSLESSNDFSRTQADDSISTIDLRLKLHLYKVRFLLLTRNLKAAKREVKMAMNIARGKDYTTALYLKSQLEYARGNHRKAIKLLMASSNRTEIGISSIYHNNLGCIYYRLGKYNAANVFFSRALSNGSSLRKERPLKLATLSQDKSLHIVYNCGMLHLACGRPLPAVRCFQKASVIFYNRPLLWLRIAECCIMALEKGLLNSRYSAESDSLDVKVHVIGNGKWRQLTLQDGASGNGPLGCVEREDTSKDDKHPNLSIPFARQCLMNGLHLLEISDSRYSKYSKSGSVASATSGGNESGDAVSTAFKNVASGDSKAPNAAVGSGLANVNGEVKEQKGGIGQNASLHNSISDYEEICVKENHMIQQALLADLAFIELELGNALKALSTARSLLKLPECSRIYTFLGNLYAAEALCLLNRPMEAAEHLFVYVAGDKNVELPYTQDDFDKWRVEKVVDFEDANGASGPLHASSPDDSQGVVMFLKPEEARGSLYANLAALSASQGDLEQAQQFVLQALSVTPCSREVILTAIYLDLVQGKPGDALAKLKHCNRIRYVPGNLTLNGSN